MVAEVKAVNTKMLKILSSSLFYGENFNQEINFGDSNIQKQKEESSIEFSTLPSSVLNYITTALNNTFFNSADTRIAEYRNNKIVNETLNKISDDFEIFKIQNFSFKDNLKMLPPSSLTYQSPSDEKTEVVQHILRDANDDIDNVYVNDDNIGSVIKSSINLGYSTVLNLMNSLDVSTLPPINIALSLSSNDSNSLDSTTISFNEIENLNHSYYHHLPPSLLNGNQFSVGISSTYASQLTGNINSISNDNGIPLVGSSSSEVGLVVASYINSTMLNNLSDFLLNNSTDEQYLIKMHGNNLEQGSGDESNDQFASGAKRDFVFDRTDVKIIFITLYSLVFCCCFFGNLLVILVVTLSRRLRSITNFFLANLAVADFCVGVFCVMQNLTIYLIDSWVFGKFLCKMYQFVHSLSYTASIFILVVICMERYFAIIHPITCKQILTPSRLRLVILGVWITSAVYSTPKFIFSKTITNIHTINGIEEHICILDRQMFNSELLDLINFGFLYVTPLLVMTILYSRIAIALWKSSRGLERHIALQSTSTCSPSYSGAHLHRKPSSMKYENQPKGGVAVTESQVSIEADKVIVTTWKKSNSFHQRHGTQVAQISNSTNNVLRARRGVIRMLIIVVLTFALCNLPYHARKMWMYWSDTYKGYSNFNALFTPLTFLATYFNSGVNPLLYAFLSRNFRKGMRELLLCSFRKNKNKSLSMHQRVPLQEVASVVMQVVNLPLERLKENSVSSDLANQHKSLQQDDSIKEQQTEIVSTEEL